MECLKCEDRGYTVYHQFHSYPIPHYFDEKIPCGCAKGQEHLAYQIRLWTGKEEEK